VERKWGGSRLKNQENFGKNHENFGKNQENIGEIGGPKMQSTRRQGQEIV
jgi:hypothetical protein